MKRVSYAPNRRLLEEIHISRAQGYATKDLIGYLIKIAAGTARRGNFSGYSYVEDIEAEGLMALYVAALKFDPAKGDKPFAYYSTVVHNAFLRVLKSEQKAQRIRDDLIEDAGMRASSSRQVNNEAGW